MSEEKTAEQIANALKPPKCPYCGAELQELKFMGSETVSATFYIDNEMGEYDNWDSFGTEDGSECYYCPVCDKLLFFDEDDAIEFLMGIAKEP